MGPSGGYSHDGKCQGRGMSEMDNVRHELEIGPGWEMSGIGNVRDGECPRWEMSGMGIVHP